MSLNLEFIIWASQNLKQNIFYTIHSVVSLHSDIWASCKIRSLGPSGMPSFCNLSSPKNGNSIIPTRSASKRFAYFWKKINWRNQKCSQKRVYNLTNLVAKFFQKQSHQWWIFAKKFGQLLNAFRICEIGWVWFIFEWFVDTVLRTCGLRSIRQNSVNKTF